MALKGSTLNLSSRNFSGSYELVLEKLFNGDISMNLSLYKKFEHYNVKIMDYFA